MGPALRQDFLDRVTNADQPQESGQAGQGETAERHPDLRLPRHSHQQDGRCTEDQTDNNEDGREYRPFPGRRRRRVDSEAPPADALPAAFQNGTAFFASTSLIAIGGGLTLLRATNEIQSVIENLQVAEAPTAAKWEIKAAGLILILVYAFFKFAWAYRLYNYVAIMLGAMPPASERDHA